MSFKYGSSPRTRGTFVLRAGQAPRCRFIPAHAGNMLTTAERALLEAGSSPRTRGTYLLDVFAGHRQRFIPAHAGNMREFFFAASIISVHPRARGEHFRH